MNEYWNRIDFKNREKGQGKFVCPDCEEKHGAAKAGYSLSVNLTTGLYNCHRTDCGASGIKQTFERKEPKKPVMLPKLNTTELKEKSFKYLNEIRCISVFVLKRNRVSDGEHWFPQVNGNRNAIWFNYFVDGIHTNTKFRDAEKNFAQVAGAEKHFYKIDDLKGATFAIVAEGEIDALSWEEAGFESAVSIPDGAISATQQASEKKFEFIENDIDRFKGIDKIYLAMDNDPAGQAMQKELSRRFGRERCLLINYGIYKDANEVLQKMGKEEGCKQLREIYSQAQQYPLEGIQTVDDLTEMVLEIYDLSLIHI